jgi:hypothetical protein
VTDTLQTSAQSAAYQALLPLSGMQDAVAGAFMRTAAINLNYHDTNDNLPPPDSPVYPDWPDRMQYLSVYQGYARANHDTLHYPWVIFYVNHYHNTSTTLCADYLLGLSNPLPVANLVPSSRTQRWSFIFVTDIQLKEQTLCTPTATPQALENMVAHVVTHEYGHQRAGLTDNDGSTNTSNYHTGRVPQYREDVMASPEHYAEMFGYLNPVLDANTFDFAGFHNTCKANLLTNQTVH